MAFIEKCVCDVAQLIRLSSQLEVDSNSRATYDLSIAVPPYSGEYIELKWNVKKKILTALKSSICTTYEHFCSSHLVEIKRQANNIDLTWCSKNFDRWHKLR